MLVIQMPDSGDRKRSLRRRRIRALLYIIPTPLLFTSALFAANGWWLSAAVAVELWWFWAVSTDPRIRGR